MLAYGDVLLSMGTDGARATGVPYVGDYLVAIFLGKFASTTRWLEKQE